MNPYLRAAARNEALRLQALEKLQARQAEETDEAIYERARNDLGQYAGDDPSTPDVNEAWVEVEQS
jgi:hypothetical protein